MSSDTGSVQESRSPGEAANVAGAAAQSESAGFTQQAAAPARPPGVRLRFTGSGGEYFNIWVVNVKNDHLGCTAGFAAGLNGSGRGIGAAHKANRARGFSGAFAQNFF